MRVRLTPEQREAIHARAVARGSHYLLRKARDDDAFQRELEARRAANKNTYAKIKKTGSVKNILANIRARCRKKNLVCTIGETDLIVPPVCPILGIPLKGWFVNNGLQFDSPSVDRIDPTKGYTPDNIRIISWRANKIKSDATLAEIEAVANYMRKCMASDVE